MKRIILYLIRKKLGLKKEQRFRFYRPEVQSGVLLLYKRCRNETNSARRGHSVQCKSELAAG